MARPRSMALVSSIDASRRSWRRWHRWAAVIAYMAGLFALSSIPNPPVLPGEPSDKLLHLALYAGLGLVTLRALIDGRWSQITIASAAATVLIATAYGAFDEFHQSFVAGRSSEFADVVADAIGSGTAAMGLWGWGILTERMKN